MTRYNPIKVPVGNLTGFISHRAIRTVLGNLDDGDQRDSPSVGGDHVPSKALMKGGPWTKTARVQEPR